MSKPQINNEIILLRGSVQQARVQLVRKLSRDVFKLRSKKGTEEQKAKNVRKADRITAEILAIKKVKRDEITKYVLTNTLNLDKILRDQNSDPLTKIMARIANHKIFSKKIAEFKSKYSNYAEFLGPGRKKKAILEWKENKKSKKAQTQNIDEFNTNAAVGKEDEASDIEGSENNEENLDNESEVNDDASEDEDMSSDDTDQEEEDEDSDEEKTTIVKSIKAEKNKKAQAKVVKKEKESNGVHEKDVKSTKPTKEKKNKSLTAKGTVKQNKESEEFNEEVVKSTKNIKSEPVENGAIKKEKSENSLGKRKKANKEAEQNFAIDTKPDVKKKKADTSKVISKQAIVKKFIDILKEEESKPEEESKDNTDSDKLNLKIEKEVDSFFFSGDGGENYLSVALPKNKSNEEEEEYGNDRFIKKKFSRQQNDKFFSKINKFQNNSNKSDSRWEGQSNNERPNGRNKPGFNQFNGKQNDRFNDRPNNRFNGKPNDRFNGRPNNKFNDRFNNKFNDRPTNKFNDRPNNKFSNDRKDETFKKQSRDNFENKSNEVLHPSWEAKKKQQDILKKGFQGKKIVFDDDV